MVTVEGDRATPPPAIPLLGMMIDRSSFDETDDFCIDREALDTTEWAQEKKEGLADFPPPILLPNGKVRRRLRWRPRNMMKRRRDLGSEASVSGSASVSNMSLTSTGNLSQTSRFSRKSVHSFASTETQTQSNTLKSKTSVFGRNSSSKLPLPRPYYPDHFNSGVSTIGTEGGMIQVRMGHEKTKEDPDTVMVHPLQDGSTSPGELELVLPQPSPAQVAQESAVPVVTPVKKKKSGMPPLFQQRRVAPKPETTSTTGSVKSQPKISPASSPETEVTISSSMSSRSGQMACEEESISLGTLSEPDRQVDLRIVHVPIERRDSMNSSSRRPPRKEGDDAGSHFGRLCVDELRAQEQRSDCSDPSAPATSGVELEDFSDDESENAWQTPARILDDISVANAAIELRFAMSSRVHSNLTADTAKSSTNGERTPPSPTMDGAAAGATKVHTGPVDSDNCSFLEVEKNLQAILDVAIEHLQQGEYTEALEVFQEILRGQLARYGRDHYRVGTAYHNIGIVHMKRGAYSRAISAYKNAIEIRKRELGSEHQDVAVSLAQLGVAYLESNKHKKAITAFREALKIRRLCFGNQHTKVAKILNNIGCALYELNELNVAKVAFEEALHIQRQLLKLIPVDSLVNSQDQLMSIASTQSNIASIKLYHGEFDEALVDLEEALLVQQCVLSDDHPIVKRTEKSIAWVEKSRQASGRGSGGDDIVSRLTGLQFSQSILSATSLISALSTEDRGSVSPRKSRSEDSTLSVFDFLEQRFLQLHAKLDLACGGGEANSVGDHGDGEPDELDTIFSPQRAF